MCIYIYIYIYIYMAITLFFLSPWPSSYRRGVQVPQNECGPLGGTSAPGRS